MSASSRARRLRERIGARDVAVLESLREFRLMSGAQLRRLHFPDGQLVTEARKTRATLKRLTDLGLIVRLNRRVGGMRAGSESFVVGLSGWGHAVLDLGSSAPRKHRRVIDTKPAFQSHTLAVSQLAVEVHERARDGICLIEELRAEPGCWRWFGGLGGGNRVLKPDAYMRLGVRDHELAAFIEQDMNSESAPTIARKCTVYIDYWRTGQEHQTRGMFPLVWWLVPTIERLDEIRHIIRRLPAETRALFTVALTTEAANLLTQLPTEGGAP